MTGLKKGITLVEIVVVIFIISMFMVILISDFPKMLRQFALSRVVYNFAQDLRKAQDLGLSGVRLNDKTGKAITVKGYGIYVNYSKNPTKYLLYADVAAAADINGPGKSDQKYDDPVSPLYCSEVDQPGGGANIVNGVLVVDCIVSEVDISKESSSLSIDSITNTAGSSNTSINFTPPDPITTIDNLDTTITNNNQVGIVFKNTDGAKRTVYVNTSGLISIP